MSTPVKHAGTLEQDPKFQDVLDQLPQKPSTTVRFFDRGDFFSVHGEDALLIAKDFFKTMGVVKYLGRNDTIPSVTLSIAMFESTVRELLLVRQYRCEIMAKSKSQRLGWKLGRKASPGNLQQFEQYIFRNADVNTSSIIMAVKLGSEGGGGKLVGVAFCDTNANTIGVCEFADNDQFTTFESIMVQLGAKECVCMDGAGAGNADMLKLLQIAERSGMLITPRKRKSFDTKDMIQDMDRLLKLPNGTNAAALPELDLKQAMGATASLVGYLELLDNEENFGNYTMQRFDGSQYMRLDTAATQALNLFPGPMDGGNKSMSIFGVLDQCKTAQGKRLLSQWIKQPLLDKARIEERLNLVEVFFEGSDLRDTVRAH
jgi:DNA mismatch repair protein MSH2